MKTVKTLFALLLALALLSALSVSAFADDPMGHSYRAFQIFSGKNSTDPRQDPPVPVLTDIAWGNGVNSEGLLGALIGNAAFSPVPAFSTSTTARDVAEYLATQSDNSDVMLAFARLAYQHRSGYGVECHNGSTNLSAGYYLVVDSSDLSNNLELSAYNAALLQMTQNGTFDITMKTSVPTMVKKLKDINDTTGVETDWQDSADYDVNDIVPFQVTVSVGDLTYFQTYTLALHDTLCPGLTLIQNDAAHPITLTCGQNNITSSAQFSITGDSAGNTLINVTVKDAKALGASNSTVVLSYYARLNENSVIGSAGNPNKVYLEYSNNPNIPDYIPDSTNPSVLVANPNAGPLGRTPEDLVRVFTYKLVVNKVDETRQPLVGAKFELFKEVPNTSTTSTEKTYVSLGEVDGANSTQFSWLRIDDGNYKLVETQAPAGYNTMEDIFFTVTADHQVLNDNPLLIALEAGDTQSGSVSTLAAQTSVTDGSITTTQQNLRGVVLPETGAAGNHLLYVIGSITLLGALILIVTRKRVIGGF